METTDFTAQDLAVNFYPDIDTFSSVSSPSNSELHIVPTGPLVMKTYNNGHSWYRIWSNGCIEQGGLTVSITGGTGVTVSLFMEYSSTNYSVFMTTENYPVNAPGVSSKTTSSFVADYSSSSTTGRVYWYTCGY